MNTINKSLSIDRPNSFEFKGKANNAQTVDAPKTLTFPRSLQVAGGSKTFVGQVNR